MVLTPPDRHASAQLTRLLADLYGWPTEDRPRCYECSALTLTQLRTLTCEDLPCTAAPKVVSAA